MTALAWPAPAWRERWLQLRGHWSRLRDRCVADPGFRSAASRFAPTRPLARRQAGELFDLMAGFVYSQVLHACVQLELFDRLRRAPLDATTLAAEGALSEPAATRLLEAAAVLELVERRAGDPPRYGLGRLGAALVDNPALAALVRHHAALYADLADPLALLRAPRGSARLARYWAYATAPEPGHLPPADVSAYSAVMSSSQALIADQVLDAYPVARHRCLLDVGGGEGAFLARALARAPALRGMLVDLPAVVHTASARLAQQGLGARVTLHGGDFKRTPLPPGADLVSLVRVLYDHDDAPALALLRAVHAALPPGGTVLVAEPMADTPGAERMGAAYFGLYLHAMGSGRVRSAAEHAALLRAAGFQAVRERRTALPLQTGLVVARA